MSIPDYDLDICVAVSMSGKYRERFRAFLKYGVLNIPRGKDVRVTFLIGPDFEPVVPIPSSFPVPWRFVSAPNNSPASKYYGYYANLPHMLALDDPFGHNQMPKWWMQVDDDSMTNVANLLHHLNQQFYFNDPIHLVNFFMMWRTPQEPFPDLLRKHGHFGLAHHYSPIGHEVSITSHEAMRRIMAKPSCSAFLEEASKYENAYGDIGLTLAARIAGIPTSGWERVAPIMTGNHDREFLSGELSHIHGVAPDLNPCYNNFSEAVETRLMGKRPKTITENEPGSAP